MLAKRLVISIYISDIPNNVKNRETGLIVAEKNPEQLANVIVYATQHSEQSQEMVDNAYQMAVGKFDADVNYGRLANLIKESVIKVEC